LFTGAILSLIHHFLTYSPNIPSFLFNALGTVF
jgi:hypothetical protein